MKDNEIIVNVQKNEHNGMILLDKNDNMVIKYYNNITKKTFMSNQFKTLSELIEYIRSANMDYAIAYDILPIGKLLLAKLYNDKIINEDEIVL
jgi:hypothetical protein